MKRILAAIFAVWMTNTTPAGAGELYQVSLLNALMLGVYDGEVTIGELSRHGDLGLGTVNGLDGEMVAIDGRFFRVGTDGRAVALAPDAATPFAMVTAFAPTVTAPIPAGLDLPALESWLTQLLPPANHAQAIRIDGTFSALTLRSVPRQTPPYQPLTEALKNQVTFTHQDMTGTLLGFRIPGYAKGMNAPGFHFHFIDATRSQGGHVLRLVTGSGRAAIADLDRVVVTLPGDAAFAAAALGSEGRGGANAVEGQ
ncbi:acetolactate decarboxylase [Magnetospirillum molischianum]|uniref:Alpha-acetolactate decarboxylase n=1 Tax=Magnetospirillum molischianum DSM 120 TaxID=1150626 RepID=H8FSZ9_MAGML|nr:acetolactate decarboxylase [Magnetospirillum molischianum]CCG41487.1 Alpha-acetolactate decarboxylase [Magnetospirillum molischianum DSM 120]